MTTRRGFMAAVAAAGVVAIARARPAARRLKLLILGGTGFLGPHIVEAALARDYDIALFNRGKTNPNLFPQLEKLHGDRGGDLSELANRRWDAVIDTSGYVPSEVTRAAQLLAPNVDQYVFLSSTDVYRPGSGPRDESAPVVALADATSEVVTPGTYGALKALCERAAEAAMPGRTTSLRAGLLVGPGDPTDRFTWWPVRAARGGEMLVPGAASDPLQFLDVRDLAAFVVTCLEQRRFGTYNVDAEPGAITMGTLIDACRGAARTAPAVTWVASDFLLAREIGEAQLPLWRPDAVRVDVARARAAGLAPRALARTATATLAWYREWPEARKSSLRTGLDPAREAELLAAWHAQGAAA